MSEISVVHLVWGPLGRETLGKFVASYREQPAGVDHELVVVFNGVESAAQQAELEKELDGIEFLGLTTPEPVIDLNAYRWAVDRCNGDQIFFCNSYSRFLAGDWLELFEQHSFDPNVGMIGATGTYESIHSAPFNWKMPWTKLFPPFPNAHLRTTAFMLDRTLIEEIRWKPPTGKISALNIESGKRSLSNEVKRQGLSCIVAGRDGRAYAELEWEDSRTFRVGEQENLIVADNRTDDYIAADPEQRDHLRNLAWGC
jgi:hypothetical protein